MKKYHLFLFPLLLITFSSCSDESNEEKNIRTLPAHRVTKELEELFGN